MADILAQTLNETGLHWKELKNNVIVITKATPQDPIRIGGIVVNQQGEPIPGASISIKNWERVAANVQSSTATDQNGHWSMFVPNESIVLIVKVMGYETQEIAIAKERRFRIELTEAVNELESVVVTGLFERPKEVYTGAVRSFNQEQLQQVAGNNILTALKSLDPSFQMPENINLGSNPNALPEITLRGGNSLVDPNATTTSAFNYQSNPNTPLFILDGFEVSLTRINDLDLTRIKSVDLLKDATATAIYGSRAANGVVVIETIRPQPGKLRVTYTGNTSIESVDLSDYNLLNAREKLDIEERSVFRQ